MNLSHSEMNKILVEADIEGLIAQGVPDDEYFSEAQLIINALSKLKNNRLSSNRVASIIHDVWSRSFDLAVQDMALRRSAINDVVHRIIKDLNRI